MGSSNDNGWDIFVDCIKDTGGASISILELEFFGNGFAGRIDSTIAIDGTTTVGKVAANNTNNLAWCGSKTVYIVHVEKVRCFFDVTVIPKAWLCQRSFEELKSKKEPFRSLCPRLMLSSVTWLRSPNP